MKTHYPHKKYVVWDSFDKNNERSYFVICNEKQKIYFTNECAFVENETLSKPKKPNLLTLFSAKK
jgi:hypothetical protein